MRQAVFVDITGEGVTLDAVEVVELQLEDLLQDNEVGAYDGHIRSLDCDEATLYLYGPDAEALFTAVADTLRANALTAKAEITLALYDLDAAEDGPRRVFTLSEAR